MTHDATCLVISRQADSAKRHLFARSLEAPLPDCRERDRQNPCHDSKISVHLSWPSSRMDFVIKFADFALAINESLSNFNLRLSTFNFSFLTIPSGPSAPRYRTILFATAKTSTPRIQGRPRP